ncbi:unnamed protein product [Phytophthora fragariaefolia]|uniref:Unnamed protein product n=1 Tax=Phytophthora fragariaefolia TaxID=1490495 RepID=A0A9W6XJA6_9STRA|nr:unnamed protein product [Phytophthora fragariaefolia]
MEQKWSFLVPWREILRECKIRHDGLDVVHSRDFRASNLPVHASLRCWPSLPQGYDQLVSRCSIPVPFPADDASRRDGEKLQRVREAVELFNVLATVSRPAFVQLLGEFVAVVDVVDDLFTPDFMFVFPVWECYLVGTVGSEDPVTDGSTVSWGALFGCPHDPRQYSSAFCAAMDKLEEMRHHVTGGLCDFMGRQATAEWSDGCNVVEWTAEHVAVPTRGVQEAANSETTRSSVGSFSRQLGDLLSANVPAVVQLCAVSDSTRMLKRWERSPPNSEPMSVETMKPRFAALGVANLTAALSHMNMMALRLSLDEIVDSVGSSDATSSAGLLLSTLVCAQPVCASLVMTNTPQLSSERERSPIYR